MTIRVGFSAGNPAPSLPSRDRHEPRTIGNLQILRLVAAAMVLFGHLNHEVSKKPALAVGFVPFQPIWWHCGVDIFFVVSGFIMALITRDSFGRPGAARRFLQSRVIRLVPMYWLFTTLTLLAMALVPGEMRHHTTNWLQVLGSYGFVPLTLNGDGAARPVMILGWTLNYEMLFYVIFAAAMRLNRRAGLITIGAALVIMAGAGLVFTLPLPLKAWCDPIILEFALGMLLYAGWRHRPPLATWAGLGLAALGYLAMAGFMHSGVANHFDAWRVIWGGVPAAIIAAGVLMIAEPRVAGRVKRVFMGGGDASYALYLSHPFVLSVVAVLCAKLGVSSPGLYIVVAFAACVAFAWVFHRQCETPLLRLLRHGLVRRDGLPWFRRPMTVEANLR